jgi:renalase
MTGPFKSLAASLPIHKEVKIVKIEKKSRWHVTSDQGLEFEAENIVLTAPLPQALELLTQSQIRFESELKSVQYSKALMGLFITHEENFIKSNLPSGVHSLFSMKDRGLSPEAFVMRMDPEYSDKYFGSEESQVLSDLEQRFLSAFESIPQIKHRELKKWRYVLPLTSLELPYLEVAPQLYLAGDAFLYPDIRGALLSAEALAKKLI